MHTDIAAAKRKTWGLSELAESLGVSIGFLRKEILCGNLRPTRLGTRVLVRDDEIERYLNECTDSRHAEAQSA
jgi:excisionase family DNA binding protein